MSEKTETAKSKTAKAADEQQSTVAPAKTEAEPKAHKARFDFTKLNSLAVVSLASAISWVGAVAGVITGHIALAQIKRSGERGKALAVTGLVLGYLYIAGSLAFGALMILFRIRGWVDAGDYGSFRGPNGFGGGMMGGFSNLDPQDMPGFNR